MTWLRRHFPNASYAAYLARHGQWAELQQAASDYLTYGITSAETFMIYEDMISWLLPRVIIFRQDYYDSGTACWAPEGYTIEEWVLRLDQGIEALRLEQSDDYPVERHQEIEERIRWILNNVGAMWT
jgi:hypothetical protein